MTKHFQLSKIYIKPLDFVHKLFAGKNGSVFHVNLDQFKLH